MTIRKHGWLLGPALYLVCSLAFVGYADGSKGGGKGGGYKQDTFEATVKGVQTHKSVYDHASTDRCDPSIHSDSTEKVRFKSTKPVVVTATKIPGLDEPYFIGKKSSARIPVKAAITRAANHSASSVPPDCPDNGGGVVNPGPGPDCGTKVVKPWWLSIDYYKRDHVELLPEDTAGGDPFQRCGSGMFPRLLNGTTFGKRQSAELPVSELFDKKIGKLITIGSGSHLIPSPEGYDETRIRWELSLKRFK